MKRGLESVSVNNVLDIIYQSHDDIDCMNVLVSALVFANETDCDKIFQDLAANGMWKLCDYMLSKYPVLRTSEVINAFDHYWGDACCANYDWEILRTYNRYRTKEPSAQNLRSMLFACFDSYTQKFNYGCFKFIVETFSHLMPMLYSFDFLSIIQSLVADSYEIPLDIIQCFTKACNNCKKSNVFKYQALVSNFTVTSAERLEIFKYILSPEFTSCFFINSDLSLVVSISIINKMIIPKICYTSYLLEALKYLLNFWEENYGGQYVLQRLVAVCCDGYFQQFGLLLQYTNQTWHRLQLMKCVVRTFCRLLNVSSLVDARPQIETILNQLHFPDIYAYHLHHLHKHLEYAEAYCNEVSNTIYTNTNIPCDVINSIVFSYVC